MIILSLCIITTATGILYADKNLEWVKDTIEDIKKYDKKDLNLVKRLDKFFDVDNLFKRVLAGTKWENDKSVIDKRNELVDVLQKIFKDIGLFQIKDYLNSEGFDESVRYYINMPSEKKLRVMASFKTVEEISYKRRGRVFKRERDVYVNILFIFRKVKTEYKLWDVITRRFYDKRKLGDFDWTEYYSNSSDSIIQNYRKQFSEILKDDGVDGLLKKLHNYYDENIDKYKNR